MNRSYSYPQWRSIQANPKPCKECGKERPIFSKGRCLSCAKKEYAKKQNKNRAPIPKVSKKQRATMAQYNKARNEYLESHRFCEFQECCSVATEIHHKAGRGKRTADKSLFMAVCREHHDFIHNHPAKAEAMGYWIPTSKRKVIL